MNRPALIEIGIFEALGLTLFICARSLAERYNSLTTRFRARHPGVNPPPTPKMREVNTKITTRLFRSLGIAFVLFATWMIFQI